MVNLFAKMIFGAFHQCDQIPTCKFWKLGEKFNFKFQAVTLFMMSFGLVTCWLLSKLKSNDDPETSTKLFYILF